MLEERWIAVGSGDEEFLKGTSEPNYEGNVLIVRRIYLYDVYANASTNESKPCCPVHGVAVLYRMCVAFSQVLTYKNRPLTWYVIVLF